MADADLVHLIVRKTVTIKAPIEKVWDALTNPILIQQYLFGTMVETDWKVGSPIIYRGIWQGKSYEDKGRILQFYPHTLLETTYWSPFSGLSDVPENYKIVRYELVQQQNGTKVILTQENNNSLEEVAHLGENWDIVLRGLKRVVEQF